MTQNTSVVSTRTAECIGVRTYPHLLTWGGLAIALPSPLTATPPANPIVSTGIAIMLYVERAIETLLKGPSPSTTLDSPG